MSFSAQLLLLPQWLVIAVLVTTIVGFSIIGFLTVHRFVPVKIRQIHNDVAGFVFAIVGVNYGVLLAFVVIVVWEQLNEAELNAENESSAAIVLFRALNAYPDRTIAGQAQKAMLDFCRFVLDGNDEPTEDGRMNNPAALEKINKLWGSLQAITPQNFHEQIVYVEILSRLNELTRYRTLRLQASVQDLPTVMWIAIIVGGIVTIGFTFLFGTENVRAHIIIIALLALQTAIIFYVIIELDHPNLGAVSTKPPEGYRVIVEELANL